MDSLSDHAPTGNLTPRPYQLEGIARARAAMARGVKRLLLVMATGGGKTVVAALIAHGVLVKQRRALFLAHRREIIAQTWAKLVEAGIPAAQVGVIMADGRITHPITRQRFDARARCAPMQVASVQTLAHRALPLADVVFVDEAHHARAKSYQTILDHYTAAGARIVGLTATPIRQDGRGLGELFEELLVVQSFRELAAQGYLVVPRTYTHPRLPDLSGVHTVAGEYQQDEVAAAIDTPGLVGDVVEHWISHAGGRSTAVFAASVEHSQHLAAAFLAAGVRAEHVDAKTPAIERDAMLGRLASGETQVLCNMGVCAEGWDCPRVKCIVLARPTQSLGLYLQMAGRGLRPWNATPAVLLDHAGNALRHGLPQEDREWSLATDRKKAPRVPSPKICPACQLTWPQGTTYCDPAQGGCGHTWERAERDGPAEREGELAELTEAAREEQRRATARKDLAREVWRLACRRAGIAGWARTESDRARAEVESRGLNGTLYRLFGKRDRLSAAALREALAYVTRAGVREPGEEG